MSHSTDGNAPQTDGDVPHKAGAFDIRVFIASLIGIYGIVLVIAGLVQGNDQLAKTRGGTINLWVGIGLLSFSASFPLWARLPPGVGHVVPPSDDRPPSAH